jgi:transcriptional regulator of acetoin/glycerol metabolism
MDHDWPGNVRELENVVEHVCVKCSSANVELNDLPAFLNPTPTKTGTKKRNRLTQKSILEALAQAGSNQTQAARNLGIHRATLWRKMKAFDINPK